MVAGPGDSRGSWELQGGGSKDVNNLRADLLPHCINKGRIDSDCGMLLALFIANTASS